MPQNTNVSNLHFPITSPFRACPDFSSGGSKEGVDSDHLGSSSFITDAGGNATQHLQYLPYGELFIEQRSDAAYNTPYKFSAKEKDEETGYSYFGARYYISDFSIWLSVDPMSDDYPQQSPFMYCSGNPINRIDPDGMNDGEVELLIKKDGSIKFNKISDLGGKDVQILVLSKEDKNGNHKKLADPIASKTPNETSPSSTNTNKDNSDQASIATEIPARIIISESLKRIAGDIGLVVSKSLIFVNLIFTVSGDKRIVQQDDMSNGSTKNERKSNPDAKSAAQQKIKELEIKLNNANTNSDKNEIKRQLKHWREKANNKSESHSRSSNRH